MIEYQRALARAVAGQDDPDRVPGVPADGVARFGEIVLRKRLAAVRALLPRTLALLGRGAFDARYREFARLHGSDGVGAGGYRDDAIAFARSLGEPVARHEARLAAAFGPRPSLCALRDGLRITVYARFRYGGRLRVVQLFR